MSMIQMAVTISVVWALCMLANGLILYRAGYKCGFRDATDDGYWQGYETGFGDAEQVYREKPEGVR